MPARASGMIAWQQHDHQLGKIVVLLERLELIDENFRTINIRHIHFEPCSVRAKKWRQRWNGRMTADLDQLCAFDEIVIDIQKAWVSVMLSIFPIGIVARELAVI